MSNPRRTAPPIALAVAVGLALTGCGKHPTTATQNQDAFLTQNRKEKGVVVLGSGLQYRVIKSGPAGGPHPAKGDEVKLEYTGSLFSGSVFDSTKATGQPAVMKLDGLIPAWMEALPKMRPGDEWLVYAPPNLAYGKEGRPPVIPPNSLLVFDVTLLGVLKSADNVKYALTLHSPAILDGSGRRGL